MVTLSPFVIIFSLGLECGGHMERKNGTLRGVHHSENASHCPVVLVISYTCLALSEP